LIASEGDRIEQELQELISDYEQKIVSEDNFENNQVFIEQITYLLEEMQQWNELSQSMIFEAIETLYPIKFSVKYEGLKEAIRKIIPKNNTELKKRK